MRRGIRTETDYKHSIQQVSHCYGEKTRVVGLTLAASYGEFIIGNNIETYYMAAYTEFPKTVDCGIL